VSEQKVLVAVACQRKHVYARKALVLLFFSSISVLGYSQGYISFRDEREEIQSTAKYRLGPFWIYPSIGFRDVGRDSNVYYESEAQGPVSDYTFTIFATAKISYLFRRSIILSLRENPEYVYYFEEAKERGWNNVFSPELRVLLLNRFVLNGRYLDSQIRYRVTSEFNARVYEYQKGFNGSLFLETPRGTSLGISGSSLEITYSDIQGLFNSRSLDRNEQEANLEFYYKIFPESYFFIKGGYKEYTFIAPLYRWRDAFSYQAYSGIQFPILGRVRGALSLGYKKFMPRYLDKQEFSGLVGDTSLDVRVSRFGFRFGFIRDCYFSFYADNVYFVENRWEAGVSFYLTRFLRLDYDFNYGKEDYPEETFVISPSGQLEQIKRSDLFRNHTAGFVIRIIKNTGLGLAVNYWARESNLYFENRERFSWGAYLTYEF
jgi:hypothetical protein